MQIEKSVFDALFSGLASRGHGDKVVAPPGVLSFLLEFGGERLSVNAATCGGNFLTEVRYQGIVFQHTSKEEISLAPGASLALSEDRRNELAFLYLLHTSERDGLTIGKPKARELGTAAKAMRVSPHELRALLGSLVMELMKRSFEE